MARFCGVFSPRAPGLMRRDDVQRMLAGFLRETPEIESFFFDDTAGFGLAAISHASAAGLEFIEDGSDVATFEGFVRTKAGDAEVAGQRGARIVLDTMQSAQSPELLAGGFGIACWSGERRELKLVTDPLGKHAIFYAQDAATGLIVFASELKSLLAHPIARREVDRRGLGIYLFERHVPAPYTAFDCIRRVFYGEVVRFDRNGEATSDLYWSYLPPAPEHLPLADWSDRVYAKYREVFRKMLGGHDTVGLFLSGGLDSSLIYGILKADFPEIRCIPISAHYEAGSHKSPELDLPYARCLAEHWGDDLVEVELSRRNVGSRVGPLLRQADQPFYRFGNNVAYDAMMRAGIERGATLLLTGQGGGESFGLESWQRHVGSAAPGQIPSLAEIEESHLRGEVFSFPRIEKLMGLPSADLIADFRQCFQPLTDRVQSSDPFDIMLFGFRQAGVREHLFHSSAAMMALHPARMVDALYDWGTILQASQVPSEYKGSRDVAMTKAIFHRTQRHLIPQFIYDRKKRGMPGYTLNNGDFPNLEARLLSRELVEAQGVFNPDYFEKVIKKRELRNSLLVAQAWLDIHVFKTEETFGLLEADLRE